MQNSETNMPATGPAVSYSYSDKAIAMIHAHVLGVEPAEGYYARADKPMPKEVADFVRPWLISAANHGRPLVQQVGWDDLSQLIVRSTGGNDCKAWIATPAEYLNSLRGWAAADDTYGAEYEKAKVLLDERTQKTLKAGSSSGTASFGVITSDGTRATVSMRMTPKGPSNTISTTTPAGNEVKP